MIRRFLSLVALALVAALPAAAQAKIGYADADLLLQAMPQMVQVRQTLQAEYTQRQTALQTLAQELQTRAEDYQRRQSLLTADARQSAERDLGTMQDSLQRGSQMAEQAMRRREAELMQPLLESLQTAIDAEAQAKSLDLVLPVRAGSEPLILYVNRNTVVDLTRDVAVRLGINPDGGTPAAPAAAPAARPAPRRN